MHRLRAIIYAFWYGILPWWMYEEKRHYECSYLAHLWLNITYAMRWLFFLESESDRAFEKKVNG
jgi:hypothetical protein